MPVRSSKPPGRASVATPTSPAAMRERVLNSFFAGQSSPKRSFQRAMTCSGEGPPGAKANVYVFSHIWPKPAEGPTARRPSMLIGSRPSKERGRWSSRSGAAKPSVCVAWGARGPETGTSMLGVSGTERGGTERRVARVKQVHREAGVNAEGAPPALQRRDAPYRVCRKAKSGAWRVARPSARRTRDRKRFASALDGAGARPELPGGGGLRLDSAPNEPGCVAPGQGHAGDPSSARPSRRRITGTGAATAMGASACALCVPSVAAGWLPTTPPPTRRNVRGRAGQIQRVMTNRAGFHKGLMVAGDYRRGQVRKGVDSICKCSWLMHCDPYWRG